MLDLEEVLEKGPGDVVPRVVLPKVAVPVAKEPACLCRHLEDMGRGASEIGQDLAQITPLDQPVKADQCVLA